MADKTRNGGEWTESRFNSFIKSGLRSASQRWPVRYAVLNAACVGQKINSNTGRIAKHYTCSCCGFDYPAKDIQVDHRSPVVPVTGFTTWDDLIDNLFCEADGLQILCKPCHSVKSKAENTERKTNAK